MRMYNYLNIVSEQMRCKRARPAVLKELKDHIEDQKDDYMTAGMTAQEAEEEAVRQMGDPVEVGVSLDRLHRPKMEWKLLSYIFLLSILGMVLQIFVHRNAGALLETDTMNPVIRQSFWMAVGIFVMFLICYLDYSRIGQYAREIWGLLLAGILLYYHFGVQINGGYLKVNLFAYAFIPVYAGILWNYRMQGWRGLVKSMVFLAISVLAVLRAPAIVPAFILMLIGLLLLNMAVYKKWFGAERKRYFLLIWGSVAAISIVLFLMLLHAGWFSAMPLYQMERIQGIFHPMENGYYQMSAEVIGDGAEAFKSGTKIETSVWATDVRGDFLWLCIFRYLGKGAGIICTILVAGLLVYLCRIVFRQKNRLGNMMGIGCTFLIVLQVILYVGMNFGCVPPINVFMPFLSFGGTNLLIIYVYMGLILSICYNSNVVKN